MLKDGEVKYLNQTSLIIKLIDGQRKLHYHKHWNEYINDKMNKYLEPEQIKTYAYKPTTGGAKIETFMPKKFNGSKKAFLQEFRGKFKTFMQI